MARILVIGAHPDDADIRAGGLACVAAERGHAVKFVSMTDGRGGHHEVGGEALVERRRAEAAAAAEIPDITYEVRDDPDGELRPTLDRREDVIRLIRRFRPDLVLTHRPNDYHPDHRYTSQLVRDAAYIVTVPNVCPTIPALETNPAFAYVLDSFERPYPFSPDLFVPLADHHRESKYDMLHCHESQMYEWLPYNKGIIDAVPDDPADRRRWLETDPFSELSEMRNAVTRYRHALEETSGAAASEAEYVEMFELSEYGGSPPQELLTDLFIADGV